MLTNTFLHIPGVGPATEKSLWAGGIRSWQDFIAAGPDLPFSCARREHMLSYLQLSQAALAAGNHAFFAKLLPAREHWRAFPEFSDRIAYLDIETTGMGGWAEITLIGIFDSAAYRAYLADADLHLFPGDIGSYSLLVTFFGTGFDLPFLRRAFPHLRMDQLHIDLCFLARRLGLRGGLKAIEERLGIRRSSSTTGLSGYDAVRLWREYLRGSEKALELLIEYNMEDVINMECLLRFCYFQMRSKLGFED